MHISFIYSRELIALYDERELVYFVCCQSSLSPKYYIDYEICFEKMRTKVLPVFG